MKVYLVGHDGPEHNYLYGVFSNYKKALKRFNEIRIDLLNDAKSLLKTSSGGKEMWRRIIKNLKEKDPEKIDNYPHDTPYIREEEVL